MEKPNPYKQIEATDIAPESLKIELGADVDIIRQFSQFTDLYIGNFIQTATFLFQPSVNKSVQEHLNEDE